MKINSFEIIKTWIITACQAVGHLKGCVSIDQPARSLPEGHMFCREPLICDIHLCAAQGFSGLDS